MRYINTEPGPYEAGLTAKSLYNIVEGLIRQHVTEEDVQRSAGTADFGLSRLSDIPTIRKELDEFVRTYLFGDLQVHTGIEEVFKIRDAEERKQRLIDYQNTLERKHGKEESKKLLLALFEELSKRSERLSQEIYNVAQVEGNSLIKNNTMHGFGQISTPYIGRIDLAVHYIVAKYLVGH